MHIERMMLVSSCTVINYCTSFHGYHPSFQEAVLQPHFEKENHVTDTCSNMFQYVPCPSQIFIFSVAKVLVGFRMHVSTSNAWTQSLAHPELEMYAIETKSTGNPKATHFEHLWTAYNTRNTYNSIPYDTTQLVTYSVLYVTTSTSATVFF